MQECLVANCRRNAEANYGTYHFPRPPRHGSDKRRLHMGHGPKSVSRTVSFLGKDGSISFSKVTGVMVNCTAGFGLEIPCMYWFYYAWPPGLHREAQEPVVVAKNFTDRS